MKSLHDRRIACEGWKGGGFIALEEVQIILWGIEIGQLQLGHVVLQIAPDPLNRGQLGALQGQAQSTSVPWVGEPGGGVLRIVVQQANVEGVREGLEEGIDEEPDHLRVQIRQR